jgi:hypothetical protein
MPLQAVALAKSMKWEIPVWGVLGLLCALAYWLITTQITTQMQQQQLLQGMAELKIAVQTGNNQTVANTGELAIMKFRMEKVEADHARMLAGQMPMPTYTKPGRQ